MFPLCPSKCSVALSKLIYEHGPGIHSASPKSQLWEVTFMVPTILGSSVGITSKFPAWVPPSKQGDLTLCFHNISNLEELG